MCFTKMVRESYLNYSSVFNLVDYALYDKSTGGRVRFYGGYNVDINRADEQIMLVKNYYRKDDGRKMRHFIVSFDDDISAYDAYVLGWRIAAFYANRYQIVFGVHEDTDNVHIHFVFNTVSFADGLKYCDYQSDLYSLKAYVNQVYDDFRGV